MRRHRIDVATQASQLAAGLDAIAQRLGVPERGPALATRLPTAATRNAAARLVKQHATTDGNRAHAALAVAKAAQDLRRADAAAADAPAPADTTLLRIARDAAHRDNAIDDLCATAAHTRHTSGHDAAIALAGLPLFAGTLDQLAAAPPPLPAEADRLATALEDATAAGHAAASARADNDRALAACRATKAGIAQAGPLPTHAAIVDARARRNAAWHAIRRHFVDRGAPPSAADWPGLTDPATDLPPLLDHLLHDADALADRAATEAERVAT